MRCLVLGGGGFIGLNLCEALLAIGHQVRVFERPKLRINEIARQDSRGEIVASAEWMEGDFTNPVDVESAVADTDVIFHLICTTLPKSSNENPVYDIESNVIATVRLLEAARRQRVKKIVFISSGGTVYGIPQMVPIHESHPTAPICSYGITKLAVEKYLYAYHYLYGLEYCVLRVANPYGEHQRVKATQGAVAVFLHRALRNEPIEVWGDGSVVRDYVYIEDVINAFLKAMDYRGSPRTFNVGSGRGHSIVELLKVIESLLGHPIVRVIKGARNLDVPVNVLDISNARDFLKWEPRVPLRDGLKRTLDWIKKQPAVA